MTKQEFLTQLHFKISKLPQAEIQKSLDYYSEIIDDRIEDGMTETEAIKSLDNMDTIVEQIMCSSSFVSLIGARAKSGKTLGVGAVIAISLTFPIWFPLIISAFAVIFSLFTVAVSLVFSLFALLFALAVSGLALIGTSPLLFAENIFKGLFQLGGGFICISISVLLFAPTVALSKLIIKVPPFVVRKIKSLISKKPKEEEFNPTFAHEGGITND